MRLELFREIRQDKVFICFVNIQESKRVKWRFCVQNGCGWDGLVIFGERSMVGCHVGDSMGKRYRRLRLYSLIDASILAARWLCTFR